MNTNTVARIFWIVFAVASVYAMIEAVRLKSGWPVVPPVVMAAVIILFFRRRGGE